MVSVTVGSRERKQGLFYMEPRRDMKEVVDLLQEAFGDQMDPEARLVLREMRLVAHLAPWLGGWVLGPGVYGSSVVGFVWLENGRVVGHATVQRMDYGGIRWQIANVAVAKPYRGRGIGRALMEASLDHIRRERGVWAVLQVRENNPPAVHLYRSLGFEAIGGETRWVRDLTPDLVRTLAGLDRLPLTSLSPEDSAALHDLRARSLGEGGRWWWQHRFPRLALAGHGFWLRRILGLLVLRRLGYRERGQLLAWLDLLVDRVRDVAEFLVEVDTRHWGKWEEALVARAVREAARLGAQRLTIRGDLEHTQLLDALRSMGFQEEHRLLYMRRKIG